MTGLAARVCRAWVRIYTLGLPAAVAARRRAEVESDLWEHTADGGGHGANRTSLTIDVLGRVLSGAPADLLWRRAIRQRSLARPRTGGTSMSSTRRVLDVITIVLVSFQLAICISRLPLAGSNASDAGPFELALLAVGVVLLGGALLIRATRPVLSTVLIALGTPIGVASWYWLPPVYLIGGATIVFAIITTRRPEAEPAVP